MSFRGNPLLDELDRNLVPVRFAEDRRKGGRGRVFPDAVVVFRDEPEREFPDIRRNERDARKDGRVLEDQVPAAFDVDLPRARVRFADDERPPAAATRAGTVGRRQLFGRELERAAEQAQPDRRHYRAAVKVNDRGADSTPPARDRDRDRRRRQPHGHIDARGDFRRAHDRRRLVQAVEHDHAVGGEVGAVDVDREIRRAQRGGRRDQARDRRRRPRRRRVGPAGDRDKPDPAERFREPAIGDGVRLAFRVGHAVDCVDTSARPCRPTHPPCLAPLMRPETAPGGAASGAMRTANPASSSCSTCLASTVIVSPVRGYAPSK